jgi:hypothetical protein
MGLLEPDRKPNGTRFVGPGQAAQAVSEVGDLDIELPEPLLQGDAGHYCLYLKETLAQRQ